MYRIKKLKWVTTIIVIFSLFAAMGIAFMRGAGQPEAEGHNESGQAKVHAGEKGH